MQSDGTFAASEVNAFSFSESFYTAAGRPLLLSVSSNATGTKFDNFAAFTGTEDAGSSASVVPIITNMRSQSRIF
jgi:hypothetical protein